MPSYIPWIAVGVVSLIALYFRWAYHRTNRSHHQTASLVIEMILSEQERDHQKAALKHFIEQSNYPNADMLNLMACEGVIAIGRARARSSMPANRDLMWVMNQSPGLIDGLNRAMKRGREFSSV